MFFFNFFEIQIGNHEIMNISAPIRIISTSDPDSIHCLEQWTMMWFGNFKLINYITY